MDPKKSHSLTEAYASVYEETKVEEETQTDSFDLIKGHLIDEGYADNEKAALAIMANMSEEWRQSIVEGDDKKYSIDGHGNKYRDYTKDGLSDRQRRMKEFGQKRTTILLNKV